MNDRAVSQAVGYVLGLSIMFLLVTGLFTAGGEFVDDQRDQAVRSELEVVGQQVSNNLARVDRMVDAADATNVGNASTQQRLPPQVAGSSYNVELINDTADPYLLLSTTRPDVSVQVNVVNRTSVANSRLDGGQYVIAYNESQDRLVMDDE